MLLCPYIVPGACLNAPVYHSVGVCTSVCVTVELNLMKNEAHIPGMFNRRANEQESRKLAYCDVMIRTKNGSLSANSCTLTEYT